MPKWIDDSGATLEKLHEHGKLWVCERVPYAGGKSVARLEIKAHPGDSALDLLRGWWLLLDLGPAASDAQELQGQLHAVWERIGSVALVVCDAHVLKGSTLNDLRLLTELPRTKIVVVLQGDVSAIDMTTRDYPSFYQRALYCSEVHKDFFLAGEST